MSIALRASLLVPFSLALLAFAGAAYALEDTNANDACPDQSFYVYVSDVKYGEKIGDKVNLYGKTCVDYEHKDKAAEGHCVGPKNCKADLCDGKPCVLQKIPAGNPVVIPPETPRESVPSAPGGSGSLLGQMLNQTPIGEPPLSAEKVGEVLKPDAEESFLQKLTRWYNGGTTPGSEGQRSPPALLVNPNTVSGLQSKPLPGTTLDYQSFDPSQPFTPPQSTFEQYGITPAAPDVPLYERAWNSVTTAASDVWSGAMERLGLVGDGGSEITIKNPTENAAGPAAGSFREAQEKYLFQGQALGKALETAYGIRQYVTDQYVGAERGGCDGCDELRQRMANADRIISQLESGNYSPELRRYLDQFEKRETYTGLRSWQDGNAELASRSWNAITTGWNNLGNGFFGSALGVGQIGVGAVGMLSAGIFDLPLVWTEMNSPDNGFYVLMTKGEEESKGFHATELFVSVAAPALIPQGGVTFARSLIQGVERAAVGAAERHVGISAFEGAGAFPGVARTAEGVYTVTSEFALTPRSTAIISEVGAGVGTNKFTPTPRQQEAIETYQAAREAYNTQSPKQGFAATPEELELSRTLRNLQNEGIRPAGEGRFAPIEERPVVRSGGDSVEAEPVVATAREGVITRNPARDVTNPEIGKITRSGNDIPIVTRPAEATEQVIEILEFVPPIVPTGYQSLIARLNNTVGGQWIRGGTVLLNIVPAVLGDAAALRSVAAEVQNAFSRGVQYTQVLTRQELSRFQSIRQGEAVTTASRGDASAPAVQTGTRPAPAITSDAPTVPNILSDRAPNIAGGVHPTIPTSALPENSFADAPLDAPIVAQLTPTKQSQQLTAPPDRVISSTEGDVRNLAVQAYNNELLKQVQEGKRIYVPGAMEEALTALERMYPQAQYPRDKYPYIRQIYDEITTTLGTYRMRVADPVQLIRNEPDAAIIAGLKFTFPNHTVTIDNSLGTQGGVLEGIDNTGVLKRFVLFSNRELSSLPEVVARFIAAHEEGHTKPGELTNLKQEELRADIEALQRGFAEGWLRDKADLDKVEAAFKSAPPSRDYPSVEDRRANLDREFDRLVATLPPGATAPVVTRATPPPPLLFPSNSGINQDLPQGVLAGTAVPAAPTAPAITNGPKTALLNIARWAQGKSLSDMASSVWEETKAGLTSAWRELSPLSVKAPLAAESAPQLTEETKTVTLGNTNVSIHIQRSGEEVTFIRVHPNETNAGKTGEQIVKEVPGTFADVLQGGNRNIEFTQGGVNYQVDPNRIFPGASGRLVPAPLARPFTLEAAQEVNKLSNAITGLLLPNKPVVALHNNAGTGYTIASYSPGGNQAAYATALYINPNMSPQNFVVVSTKELFDGVKAKKINVVWEDRAGAKDDGSLLAYAQRNNISYATVETAQGGNAHDQLEIVRKVLPVMNVAPNPPQTARAPDAPPAPPRFGDYLKQRLVGSELSKEGKDQLQRIVSGFANTGSRVGSVQNKSDMIGLSFVEQSKVVGKQVLTNVRASYYGTKGALTASGITYDTNQFVISIGANYRPSESIRFGTKVLVEDAAGRYPPVVATVVERFASWDKNALKNEIHVELSNAFLKIYPNLRRDGFMEPRTGNGVTITVLNNPSDAFANRYPASVSYQGNGPTSKEVASVLKGLPSGFPTVAAVTSKAQGELRIAQAEGKQKDVLALVTPVSVAAPRPEVPMPLAQASITGIKSGLSEPAQTQPTPLGVGGANTEPLVIGAALAPVAKGIWNKIKSLGQVVSNAIRSSPVFSRSTPVVPAVPAQPAPAPAPTPTRAPTPTPARGAPTPTRSNAQQSPTNPQGELQLVGGSAKPPPAQPQPSRLSQLRSYFSTGLGDAGDQLRLPFREWAMNPPDLAARARAGIVSAKAWCLRNKILCALGVGGAIAYLESISYDFSALPPAETPTPAAPPPAKKSETVPPVVKKVETPPYKLPVVRREVVPIGAPTNVANLTGPILDRDYYCITRITPLVVKPVPAGTPFPSNCYNNPGGGSTPSSFGNTLGQLLGKIFGTSSPTPTPSTKPPTPPVTPPYATSTAANPLATLIANPVTVALGRKSLLAWSSINTSNCELFAPHSIRMATGTRGSTSTLALSTSTQFTLNCGAPSGATTSAQTTVTVHE